METIPKLLLRSVAAAVFVAFAAASARADADEDRIAALQAKFRCPIFEYLSAIHRRAHKEKEQNRFLVAEIAASDPNYFVQCAFFDMDRQLHCEAASAYYDPRLKDYFTADRLKELGALGYSTTVSSMNYYFERRAPNAQALYDIAGIIVTTFGRVFEMQPDETLAYHAPLVKTPPVGKAEGKFCSPLIS